MCNQMKTVACKIFIKCDPFFRGVDSAGVKTSLVTAATRVRHPMSAYDRVVVACPRSVVSPPGHSGYHNHVRSQNANIHTFENTFFCRGARWLSGRVSDSGARGRGFETYLRRVVSLSKTLYSPKVLVNYPGSGGSVPT